MNYYEPTFFDKLMSFYEFGHVRTFQDLIDVNILFLTGHLKLTPYHFGPITDDVENISKDIITNNRRGFITIDGQAAMLEVAISPLDGKKYITTQLPYLCGFLHIDYLLPFYDFMKTKKDYGYLALTCTTISTVLHDSRPFIDDLNPEVSPGIKKYNSITETLSSRLVPLTTVYDEGENSIEYYSTSRPITDASEFISDRFADWDDFPVIVDILKNETVYVEIVGKTPDTPDIGQIMVEFFDSIKKV